MQYKIRGKVIASELAAKPPSQASTHLLTWLKHHEPVPAALDYGCGKLRYAGALAGMAKSVTLVDSSIQLDRHQIIDGKQTTVRLLARKRWPFMRIETVEEFQGKIRPKFDFALCANVLSAIPDETVRSRALSSIRARLKLTGRLLIVNQHTNSSFTDYAERDDTVEHLDGWMVQRKNTASYYGILDRTKIRDILEGKGYRFLDQWVEGQSNYALVVIR